MSDLSTALQNVATLVSCVVSKWDAKITNRSAMNKLNQLEHATGDTGEVRIKLLANADTEYKKLCAALDAVRTQVHYKLTLPWAVKTDGMRGPRLLPNMHFETYMDKFAAHRQTINQLKEEFGRTLPASIAKAQQTLGGLTAHYVYPTPEEILERFNVTLDIQPIPSGAEFRGLDKETTAALEQLLQQRHEQMLGNAMAEVWGQVKDRLEHLDERLQVDEDGNSKRLYTSTVDNVRELVTTLGGFNLTNDPRIEQIRQEIGIMITGLTADSLRDNTQDRDRVALAAQQLKNKLSEWGI